MLAHLTEPNPDLAEKVRATPPGMAHWAGTGPQGTRCGGCKFFRAKSDESLFGSPEGSCQKYAEMMRAAGRKRQKTLLLPSLTASCRHFEPYKPKA